MCQFHAVQRQRNIMFSCILGMSEYAETDSSNNFGAETADHSCKLNACWIAYLETGFPAH